MTEPAETPKDRLLRHADYLDRQGRRTLADDLRSWVETQPADTVMHAEARFCLCSDPDWCLRNSDPEYRAQAIAYRREHGAPLPKNAPAPAGGAAEVTPFGRWCEKCEQFVPADHHRAMLQIPHRQPDHNPIVLYSKTGRHVQGRNS